MKRFTWTIALLIAAGLFIRYYPIKPAINEDDVVLSDKTYIICSAAYVTGFEWVVEKSYSSYEGYVFVEGVMENPYSIKYDVAPYSKFVLYGEFVGERAFADGVYPVFKAENWDVLKPIKRDSALPDFLSPPYGLTWLDFYQDRWGRDRWGTDGAATEFSPNLTI